MTRIGPGFAAEIEAAGLLGLPFAWSFDGVSFGDLSEADRARVQAVIDAHDPDAEPPAAVPPAISDRQFAQALAMGGVITEEEALAWAARGELPNAMEAAIGSIPEDARFAARMLLSSATTYERDHQLVGALGSMLGYNAAELDDLWRIGATL